MAYVLSSVSGNLISAASAGFAPTNSADVSAIASAYQVVSATATQLYAGTAYVTSVNDAPISAARAGNAANASMANSAYYDGTGRLISALPDEAAVSAIASAYAESAASSKQDTLTFGYDAEDKISGINGSSLAGGEQVVTSLQYTTSQSGAIIGYTTGDRAGGGEKVFSARYYPNKGWYNYQSSTALASVGVTSVDSYITGNTEYPFEIFMIPYGAANYGNINYISSVGSYMSNYGQFNNTSDFRIATGMATLSGYSAILDFNVTSLPFNTQYGSPMWGTGGGMVLEDSENSQPVFAVVFGSGSDREGRCARITDGPKALGFGAITTVSAVSGINELGIAGGAGGGIDSATCSAIASAYAESAVSSKADSSALSSYVPYSSLEYNTASAISGINGSALAAGSTYSAGEGIDITDDVISVETPVDIVAGPGIHIDNPDGNTLRVSMAQDYEVTLWSGTGTSGSTINLSETVKNFDRVRFYGHESNRGRGCLYEINPSISYDANTLQFAISTTDAAYAGAAWFVGQYLTYLTYTDTAATAMTVNGGEQWFSFSNSSAVQHNTARYVIIDKIVGINRTASAQ